MFKPGVSGNKKGRPRGSTDRKNKLEKAFDRIFTADKLDDIIMFLYDVAMADERLPVKPTTVERLRAADSLLDKAKQFYRGEMKTKEEKDADGDEDEVVPAFKIS